MRVALYFVTIGMGWWSLGWGCCVVRVELVCWRLIWFQCHYLVMGLVMLCSLFLHWWSWCWIEIVVIVIVYWEVVGVRALLWFEWGVGFVWSWFVVYVWLWFLGLHLLWCVFCGQESVVILNDSWDLGDLHCCVDQSYEVIIVEWLWFLILELVL